ncbi:MAG: hypothetical protein ACI4Q3_04415 [Kiritimatiellia bacterium]
MGCRKFCRFAGAAVGALSLVCGADELVVGAGETYTVASETAQTDAVRVSDRTVIEKTGTGTLTLATGTFTENLPVAVDVREGTLRLETSEPLVTTYPEPTEIMAHAALWMEASQNVRLLEGSEDEVADWLDVRETGAGTEENPFVYARAVAFTNDWLTAFPLQQSYLEKPGVYCRGLGSGCFMNWVKPDGTQENVTGIRHAFVAYGGPTGKGTFLGQRPSNGPYFQRNSDILWCSHNSENTPLFAARTYLNGVEVDGPRTTMPKNASHVVEVQALNELFKAMCFWNDRDMQLKTTAGTNMAVNAEGSKVNAILGTTAQTGGGDRAGGEYLHEVLLFTNSLTTAERMAVSDWLNQKWRGVKPPAEPPATSVALATGATLELAGELPETISVDGDGVVRKTGEGRATLRSRNEPRNSATRVEIEAGTLVLGYALPVAGAAGDTITSERAFWGPELAPPVPDAGAARLVKAGSGPVTLDAIPEGVTNLVVTGGELRLADPERARRLVANVCDVRATIPEADFESYPATTPSAFYQYIANGQTQYGWHAIVPATIGNGAESRVMLFDQSLGSPSGWNMILQDEPSGVLVIKNNASAWCEIQVPEDGEYALSFRAAPRKGYSGEQLDVMIGPDADSLVSWGSFKPKAEAWLTYRDFLPMRLTAGTYQFWLKSKEKNDDRCTQFDDFRLEKQNGDGMAVWDIPNGGFEIHASSFQTGGYASLANTNGVVGFTVEQRTSAPVETGVFSNTTFQAQGVNGDQFFNRPWNRPDSMTQFYMSGNGSLSTTFTPPAGTWRFRADFCNWRVKWQSGGNNGYAIEAALDIVGETVSLGTITNKATALLPMEWPRDFTVDGATPVTLTLTGMVPAANADNNDGHGILDNLALVRTSAPGRNLFQNGGFESSVSPWTVAVTPKPSGVNGSGRQEYGSFYETYFGLARFEGSSCLTLVNDDIVSQRVTFPEGGLYRFSANMMARGLLTKWPSYTSHGLNPVAFFLAQDGVTNWLGCTDQVKMTNFCEYACIVRISEPGGVYDIGFQGQTVWDGETAVDRTTLLDAAQLYRIETAQPIDLPESLEIDVASGAQLTLDFDGTNEVRRLKIAGKSYLGVVSLAERPELLGTLNGRGALFVRPRGTVLLLR